MALFRRVREIDMVSSLQILEILKYNSGISQRMIISPNAGHFLTFSVSFYVV